jgi:hypothetical protein
VTRLLQRDGISCGPCVAVVAGAYLDPAYGTVLSDGHRFAEEQRRVHAAVNRVWPRRLGLTPSGMAHALSKHRPYRWRLFRGRRDELADAAAAVASGRPVAMLIGRVIPRHWVLLVELVGDEFRCYEPSSGDIRPSRFDDIRRSRLVGLGFPRPFAFVLPHARGVSPRACSPARAPSPSAPG